MFYGFLISIGEFLANEFSRKHYTVCMYVHVQYTEESYVLARRDLETLDDAEIVNLSALANLGTGIYNHIRPGRSFRCLCDYSALRVTSYLVSIVCVA